MTIFYFSYCLANLPTFLFSLLSLIRGSLVLQIQFRSRAILFMFIHMIVDILLLLGSWVDVCNPILIIVICFAFCNKCSSTQVIGLFFCPFQGQTGDVTDQLENDTISQSPPKTSRRSAGREKQVLQKVKLLAVPNATSSIIRSLFQTSSMATRNFFQLIHRLVHFLYFFFGFC